MKTTTTEKGNQMKTQHTAGPWKYGGSGSCAVYSTENGSEICEINHAPNKYDGEASANARLIAAAPELYEALKALARLPIETCPRCDGTGQRLGVINEACGQCGGTGKDTGNPHPDEILKARAAIAKCE